MTESVTVVVGTLHRIRIQEMLRNTYLIERVYVFAFNHFTFSN
jgi:hypothetical protein